MKPQRADVKDTTCYCNGCEQTFETTLMTPIPQGDGTTVDVPTVPEVCPLCGSRDVIAAAALYNESDWDYMDWGYGPDDDDEDDEWDWEDSYYNAH